jgi:anion-transporting  ArsA/GET3 family ATPase
MRALLDQQLLVIAGKGGVGRTTVAAALASLAARRGKRVLLAQTQANERLSTLLGSAPVGPEIVRIRERLDAVNMTPEASLREYGMMVLRYAAVYRAVFENRVSRAFLRAIPGLDEYSMLGKAWYHTTERSGDGPRWDLVILDGPATGHLVKLLSIPRAIVDAVPEGPLTRDARALLELLADPGRSAAVVVALPEEMAATEAIELGDALGAQVGLRVGSVVVNGLYSSRFSGDSAEAQVVGMLDGATLDGALGALVDRARFVRARRHPQDRSIARLAASFPSAPQLRLPLLFSARFEQDSIRRLDSELEGQLAAPGVA